MIAFKKLSDTFKKNTSFVNSPRWDEAILNDEERERAIKKLKSTPVTVVKIKDFGR